MQNQIPKNWQKVKLGKVVDIRRGASPRPIHEYISDSGMPWLKIADVTSIESRYVDFTKEFIKEEGIPKSVTVKPGDLILSNSATPGIPRFMRITACVHDGWLILNPALNLVDKNYLFYRLMVDRRRLVSNVTGAVFDNLKTDILRDHEIQLPSIDEQKQIASVLSAFDDKIEVNNKIAKTLEEMVQAIFKEWFVRFKFPGYEKVKFVDSELGKIPVGWKFSNIGDVSNNFDSKRIPLSNVERAKRKGKYPYYGATGIMDYIDKPLFKGEYLLIAEDGTVMTESGKPILQFIEGEFWVNNHAHVIKGKGSISTAFLYYLLKNVYIKPYITGAVQLKLNQENLNSIPVIIPFKEILESYNTIVGTITKKARNIERETQKLAAMRDLLLPKLMRGEVRV